MRSYEYRHVSTSKNQLGRECLLCEPSALQGRVREMFLRDHAPGVLRSCHRGSTCDLRVSCEYLVELAASMRSFIRMSLGELAQNRVTHAV